MSKVRVKHHKDPTAVPSFGEGPDDHGGYLIDESELEHAQAHGFHVKHLHDDTGEQPAADAQQNDNATDEGSTDDQTDNTDDPPDRSDSDSDDKTEVGAQPPVSGEQKAPRRRLTR